MNEFQIFIEYTWPWVLGGFFIRVACWMIGASVYWLRVSLGG